MQLHLNTLVGNGISAKFPYNNGEDVTTFILPYAYLKFSSNINSVINILNGDYKNFIG